VTRLVTATDRAREIALAAAQAAADKLATDVVLLDVSDRLVITDVFVIASAPNERQVESIVEAVEERLRRDGVKPVRREGEREGRWVLLDFSDVVVHVQHTEERSFYGLERLWKDCPTIPFTDRVVQERASTGTPSADDGTGAAQPAPPTEDAATGGETTDR
jgi:ribosome-associated protein